MSEEKSALFRSAKLEECEKQDATPEWCSVSTRQYGQSMTGDEKYYNQAMWTLVNRYSEDRLSKLKEETLELVNALEEGEEQNDIEDYVMRNDRIRDKIVNEMVDVQIMIDQVRRRFKIGYDEWDMYINFKLRRQRMRMEREDAEG